MTFRETKLKGVWVIDPERVDDERGFFARTFCEKEFKAHGLNCDWVQDSIAFNRKKGTLRGLHYQAEPHGEIKLVRCTMGAIYDVVADVRPGSRTAGEWLAVVLSAETRRMLYLPIGVAHGYQTLTERAEVFYRISHPHHPESARGARWNDPAFGIHWPETDRILSSRDRSFPDFK